MIFKWSHISPPSRLQSFLVYFHIIFLRSVCLCNVSIIRIMHIWWKLAINNILDTVSSHRLMCILFCLLYLTDTSQFFQYLKGTYSVVMENLDDLFSVSLMERKDSVSCNSMKRKTVSFTWKSRLTNFHSFPQSPENTLCETSICPFLKTWTAMPFMGTYKRNWKEHHLVCNGRCIIAHKNFQIYWGFSLSQNCQKPHQQNQLCL